MIAEPIEHNLQLDGDTVTWHRPKTGRYVRVPLVPELRPRAPMLKDKGIPPGTNLEHMGPVHLIALAPVVRRKKDYNTWLGTPTYNFNPTGIEAKE